MPTRRLLVSLLAVAALSACSFRSLSCSMPQREEPLQPAPRSGGERALEPGETPRLPIVFLGDSLTAGYGLMTDEAYPSLLQQMFLAEGYGEVEVVNAGISGDTKAGGLRRVEQVLSSDARILVIALGGNDALRGLSASQTYENLVGIIDAARARDVGVVLTGMEAPTNLGEDYRDAFRGVFVNLLREYQGAIVFVPFLLEGVAGNPALNQPDGIHPTAEGARVIATLLYPRLRTLVDQFGGGGGE
jgi:acyl-CoA thioesterase I